MGWCLRFQGEKQGAFENGAAETPLRRDRMGNNDPNCRPGRPLKAFTYRFNTFFRIRSCRSDSGASCSFSPLYPSDSGQRCCGWELMRMNSLPMPGLHSPGTLQSAAYAIHPLFRTWDRPSAVLFWTNSFFPLLSSDVLSSSAYSVAWISGWFNAYVSKITAFIPPHGRRYTVLFRKKRDSASAVPLKKSLTMGVLLISKRPFSALPVIRRSTRRAQPIALPYNKPKLYACQQGRR